MRCRNSRCFWCVASDWLRLVAFNFFLSKFKWRKEKSSFTWFKKCLICSAVIMSFLASVSALDQSFVVPVFFAQNFFFHFLSLMIVCVCQKWYVFTRKSNEFAENHQRCWILFFFLFSLNRCCLAWLSFDPICGYIFQSSLTYSHPLTASSLSLSLSWFFLAILNIHRKKGSHNTCVVWGLWLFCYCR